MSVVTTRVSVATAAVGVLVAGGATVAVRSGAGVLVPTTGVSVATAAVGVLVDARAAVAVGGNVGVSVMVTSVGVSVADGNGVFAAPLQEAAKTNISPSTKMPRWKLLLMVFIPCHL